MTEAQSYALSLAPFGPDIQEKTAFFLEEMVRLTKLHQERCPEYARLLTFLDMKKSRYSTYADIPFIPVRLFKEYDLKSVAAEHVAKVLTSSGTTGQKVSRIFLDKDAAVAQSQVLSRIVADFTGSRRLPYLVVDVPSLLHDRASFSARAAGVLGFSLMGSGLTYLLRDDYSINFEELDAFQARWQGRDILLFGFTSVVWQSLCQQLEAAGRRLDLRGILIHGGGWKKLQGLSVDNVTFKNTVRRLTGVATVANYYGMVEQTGSIFMECAHGHLHASVFSEVIIRDPVSHAPLPAGEPGLVQLLSLLPTSYPGHSILTEDMGVVLGVDDCPCGRKGTYFHVLGRIKNAEIRGCSDAVAS